MNFSVPGYDIKRNDRTWSTKGGVAFLYKSELILNKVYDNSDFNIITNSETLAIELELSLTKQHSLWPPSIAQICSGRLPHFQIK